MRSFHWSHYGIGFKYFDENNEEVPYNKIWGRRYEYCKLTSSEGTLFYQNNVIADRSKFDDDTN